LFTNILFVLQVCQPLKQMLFVSKANRPLIGTLTAVAEVNSIYAINEPDTDSLPNYSAQCKKLEYVAYLANIVSSCTYSKDRKKFLSLNKVIVSDYRC